MSVRVTDGENAALYDSTSGIAFGPVFESQADAADFLEWYGMNHELDPRQVHPAHLLTLVNEWHQARDEEADL